MLRMLGIILCMLCSTPTAAYKLVREKGEAPFKWGAPQLGTGARITYAIARGRFALEGGFARAGCDTVESLEPMLEGSGIDEARFAREIRRGIERWSAVADVRFVAVEDAAAADVVIGAQLHPRGTTFANVRATRAGALRSAEKAIVCINPSRILTEKQGDCTTRFSIAYLMAHEFGHVLGLDHPAASGSLMAFRCSEDHLLNEDDAAGARHLYGPAR